MATEKFPFDPEFQTMVLAALRHSHGFLANARRLISPDSFAGDEQWILCSLIFGFFDKYGTAPRHYLGNELDKYLRKTKVSDDQQTLLYTLLERLTPALYTDEHYVQDEIVKFAQHARLRIALEEFIPQFNQGEYDVGEVMEKFEDVRRLAIDYQDLGVDYLDTLQQRVNRRKDKVFQEYFATLIDVLDEKFIGIQRQQLGTIMAPGGIGKSYMLTHIGKAGLIQGLNVAHYTLEMSVDEIMDRYDMMAVASTKEDLNKLSVVKHLEKQISALSHRGGKLFLKYLSESADVYTIRAHLESLRVSAGFVPDLVVIDYGELLKPLRRYEKSYDSQGEIWRSLRGIGVDLNCGIWTATQSSKAGVGARVITELETSDSYNKYRISDIFIGFNRNLIYDQKHKVWLEEDDEGKPDLVRLHVVKHRGRRDKYTVRFLCDLDRGQFYSKKKTDALIEAEATKKKDDMEDF